MKKVNLRLSESTLNSLVRETANKLGKKYDMSLVGIGGGETEEGIWLIRSIFSKKSGTIPKSEGRKMIVDCVEAFIASFNQDSAIRPFLRDYPLTFDNIEISIINFQKDGNTLFDPDIEVFSYLVGRIFYRTRDPINKVTYKSKTSELYVDALEKVKRDLKNIK